MIQAYVVTEGEHDLELFKKLLPADIVSDVEFVEGSGSYAAESLACTILAVKQRPVALVLDAGTTNEVAVQERHGLVGDLLRQSAGGVQYEVLLAVPELEIVFFQNRAILERIAGRKLTDVEFEIGRFQPKDVLAELFNSSMQRQTVPDLISALDHEAVEVLRKHPLIRALSEFLSSATERSYAVSS